MKVVRRVFCVVLSLCICLFSGCGQRQCQHSVVADSPIPANCTESGLTEGAHCSVCGEILVWQVPIAPLGHQYGQWSDLRQDTLGQWIQTRVCTLCGNEDVQLSECQHVPVADAAMLATCTEDGLTEGSHCSQCGLVFTEQTVIAASGHPYGQWNAPVQDAAGQWWQNRYCSVCGVEDWQTTDAPAGYNPLGSAAELPGRTLLVTVFANDAGTAWDFSTSADMETLGFMHAYIGSAAEWITQQCSTYGVEAEFLYDWGVYPELSCTADLSEAELVRFDTTQYQTQKEFVDYYFPAETLKQKFHAQNVIYIFFFNTDKHNTVRSWCATDQGNFDTEIINIFVNNYIPENYYYLAPASTIAHEILHCFGAYDLYGASEDIPQAFVEFCAQTFSTDIMYTVNEGEEITETFSQLDAYYVGLTDNCELVEIWNLPESSHISQP